MQFIPLVTPRQMKEDLASLRVLHSWFVIYVAMSPFQVFYWVLVNIIFVELYAVIDLLVSRSLNCFRFDLICLHGIIYDNQRAV